MKERKLGESSKMKSDDELSAEIFGNTPDSLIYEILLRLPVADAIQCKTLSRSWNSQISNPNFGRRHCSIAATRRVDEQNLVVHSFDYEDENNTAVISIVDIDARTLLPGYQFSDFEDDFPSKPSFFIVGCDAGIVCIHSTLSHVSNIYLWNPLTRHFKSIPTSFNIPSCNDSVRGRERARNVILGFGYDRLGDDLKVVRIVPPSFSVEVYSAKSESWQIIASKPGQIPIDEIFLTNFDVSFNGFLFTSGTHGMITFDLDTHMFDCKKLPAPTFDPSLDVFSTFKNQTRITQFRHSIAAIICDRTDFINKIDLWALDDESCLCPGGGEASWTRMFNIEDINRDMQYVHGHFNIADFLLLVQDKWYLYNPNNHVVDAYETENENARDFKDAFHSGQIFLYRKSLFPVV